ncbi:hypothetical protein ABW19_dt0202831 [Dactylella cylindrospora]|nr:hypothetical protein ABW19_dt0202831 [Dactylella cylindrospora]
MVCQPSPSPPTRLLHPTLPTNLPARWIPHRVFVIRHRRRNICFPIKSRSAPYLHLSLPKPQADQPLRVDLRIIGWRWAVADTLDPETDLPSLGLNVKGVPGYDPSKDAWGKKIRRRPKGVWGRAWWRVKKAGRKVGRKVGSVLDRVVRMLEERWDERGEEDAGRIMVDLNFEKYMRMDPRFWG